METNGLPADLLAWVSEQVQGTITGHRRHAARREAWQIDVESGHGQPGESRRYFLRIDRALAKGQGSSRNLRRETALIRTLNSHGVPSQSILAWNDKHAAALQSWLPGSGRLDIAPPEARHTVMMEFAEALARLHCIDIGTLDLPEFERPANAMEHSLLEIEAIDRPTGGAPAACSTNPLAAFGKRWLINNAPQQVQSTVLVQGDTGPGNFMYEGSHLTGIMDWEWGHYGDPMEDLGNVWLRDFFMPSVDGDLTPYFEHYAKCSGFQLQYDSIAYYRIHQLLRSVIGLHYTTSRIDWQTTLHLNLGYRAVIDLETCAAIAEASSKPRRTVTPFADSHPDDSIPQTLALQIERLVIPQLSDPFTEDLSRGHAATMRYLDLKMRHQAEVDARQLHGLRQLLGSEVPDLERGRQQLLAIIAELRPEDEGPVLDVLYAAAVDQARLMSPLTATWARCRWAKIR